MHHAPRHILDESTARRIEEERQRECPAHEGTVLHLVPKDIDMFDQEVLSFWMTSEASANVVARAAVVPSGLTALRHHIRWVFFPATSRSGCFAIPRWPKAGSSIAGSSTKRTLGSWTLMKTWSLPL